MREIYVRVSSIFGDLTTSYNFKQDLKFPYHLKSAQLVGGYIPKTLSDKRLYVNVSEFNSFETNKYEIGNNKTASHMLLWDKSDERTNSYIIKPDDAIYRSHKQTRIHGLTVSIVDEYGLSLNDELFTIESINTTNNIIRTTSNHNLISGEKIRIYGVETINNKTINGIHTVTVLNTLEFTVGTLNSESTSSQYKFGKNLICRLKTGEDLAIKSITYAGDNKTNIEFYNNHKLINRGIMVFSGMDNGITMSDNDKLNSKHYVDVVDETNITISNCKLSSYPLLAYKTILNNISSYGGKIIAEKNFISLDWKLVVSD